MLPTGFYANSRGPAPPHNAPQASHFPIPLSSTAAIFHRIPPQQLGGVPLYQRDSRYVRGSNNTLVKVCQPEGSTSWTPQLQGNLIHPELHYHHQFAIANPQWRLAFVPDGKGEFRARRSSYVPLAPTQPQRNAYRGPSSIAKNPAVTAAFAPHTIRSSPAQASGHGPVPTSSTSYIGLRGGPQKPVSYISASSSHSTPHQQPVQHPDVDEEAVEDEEETSDEEPTLTTFTYPTPPQTYAEAFPITTPYFATTPSQLQTYSNATVSSQPQNYNNVTAPSQPQTYRNVRNTAQPYLTNPAAQQTSPKATNHHTLTPISQPKTFVPPQVPQPASVQQRKASNSANEPPFPLSEINLHPTQAFLEPEIAPTGKALRDVPLLRSPNGSPVFSATGQFLRDLPILPLRISPEVEAFRLHYYFSRDPRVTFNDIAERVALDGSEFTSTKEVIERLRKRLAEWKRRIGILGAERGVGPSKTEMRHVEKLERVQLEYNVWWDIDERRGVMSQPKPKRWPGDWRPRAWPLPAKVGVSARVRRILEASVEEEERKKRKAMGIPPYISGPVAGVKRGADDAGLEPRPLVRTPAPLMMKDPNQPLEPSLIVRLGVKRRAEDGGEEEPVAKRPHIGA